MFFFYGLKTGQRPPQRVAVRGPSPAKEIHHKESWLRDARSRASSCCVYPGSSHAFARASRFGDHPVSRNGSGRQTVRPHQVPSKAPRRQYRASRLSSSPVWLARVRRTSRTLKAAGVVAPISTPRTAERISTLECQTPRAIPERVQDERLGLRRLNAAQQSWKWKTHHVKVNLFLERVMFHFHRLVEPRAPAPIGPWSQ